MYIYLGNNPIGIMDVWCRNTYEKFDSWIWKKRRKVLTCHICGRKMAPFLEGYGPKACGWMKLKGKTYNPWICHSCLEHSESVVSEERKTQVHESNERLKQAYLNYKETRRGENVNVLRQMRFKR